MACIHDGHKKRLRGQYREGGLDSLPPHVQIELLLSFSRRGDTNEAAHRLLNRFKSIRDILDADYTELAEVSGIGECAATLISLMGELARSYESFKPKRGQWLNTPERAEAYVARRLDKLLTERILVLCLDQRRRLITEKTFSTGSVTRAETGRRAIAELAIKARAAGVIIGHNHPQASPTPSPKDVSEAVRIKEALTVIGLSLNDFIIAGRDRETYSLVRSGLLT